MAIINTINFLPDAFRSAPNQRFLGATLDQLTTDAVNLPLNGYIGRTFAPTYKLGDNYISEYTKNRSVYQLESSVVVKDNNGNIELNATYLDLLQDIVNNNGLVDNQQRLFESEYYNYDGLFDYDKFVNYNNYYWIPGGPAPVVVSSGNTPYLSSYAVTRNTSVGGYTFTGSGGNPNTQLTLARGGTYTFTVDQPGFNFWIQSEPGVTGTDPNFPSISTRQVLGVSNNGTDDGTVSFTVPQADAQSFFTTMTIGATVDAAVTFNYNDIQNQLLSSFLANFPTGLDGITNQLSGRQFIFVNNILDNTNIQPGYFVPGETYVITSLNTIGFPPTDFTKIGASSNAIGTVFTATGTGTIDPINGTGTATQTTWATTVADDLLSNTGSANPISGLISSPQRTNVWQIRLVPYGSDYVIQIAPVTTISTITKVFIGSGKTYASAQFWLNNNYQYNLAPAITANSNYLYYQDGSNPNFVGEIKLVDNVATPINITSDIIGKPNYLSPNGVLFTNGLKVEFDNLVVPASYSGNQYYVEGVGTSIQLVPVAQLEVPESYGSLLATTADYITINRSSQDQNSWSRSNSWFHVDVLAATAKYNGTVINYGSNIPGRRAIIEFDPNLQLFNHGIQAKANVDLLTFNKTVLAGNLIVGGTYTITGLGTTDFTLVGASSNAIGTSFVATGAGTGTGTTILNSLSVTAGNFVTGMTYVITSLGTTNFVAVGANSTTAGNFAPGGQYQITSVGTTDFTTIGASSNTIGVIFTALNIGTGTGTAIATDANAPTVGTVFTATGPGSGTGTVSVASYTDAFVDIEGQMNYTVDGIELVDGMRIIFATDYDPNVLNEIWEVEISTINNQNFIRLIETTDDPIYANQNVLVTQGYNAGKTFWYDGASWHESQEKTGLNQAPLFDLVDKNGYSFADTTVYPNSTFAGTKSFGYEVGTGTNDSLLGFPLTYQNFNNIGDIVFSNFYDTDSFTYSGGTVQCNSGYFIVNSGLSAPSKLNNWVKGVEPTSQYQVITKIHNGQVLTTTFTDGSVANYPFVQIDVLPTASASVPHLKVYLNNKLLNPYTDLVTIPDSTGNSVLGVGYFGVYPVILLNTTVEVGDKINVLILSDSVSQLGYYEVPDNLDLNPLNSSFSTLTLGQLRNHYSALLENTSVSPTDTPPNRDRYLKAQGGTLIQHSSPTIYGMTFLTDPDVNYVNGITLARNEYTRFKNKFLSLCASLSGIDYNNPATGVDLILKTINSVKNSSFPWYYSDMVPQGANYNTITYTVIDTRRTSYEISSIHNVSQLSNRAVLVYLNNKQLTSNNVDFYYDQSSPSVVILTTLSIGDVITIREYSNTDGNYIPETPVKLGLAQSYPPEIYTDTTYITPISVVRGHDGSITPAFGDFRDQFLLELETRIYNNLKTNYNEVNSLSLYDTLPGKFRDSDYSSAEWNQILSRNFLQWIGNNGVDYATNSWFDANNPWTWNYSQFTDIFGDPLQGSWRAIYEYWFDTDQPHLTPWEMLGIAQEPSWWVKRYGPAPYTSGNGTLWEDLEAGYIWNGSTSSAYTDVRFARPGLLGFLPVDSAGNLLNPMQIGIVARANVNNAGIPFAVGQQGPAETAWRRSSDFVFSVQQALSISRPAQYFGTQVDLSAFYKNPVTSQFSNADNMKVNINLLNINGDTVSEPGTTLRTAGYINWIGDYIRNLGIDPVTKASQYFFNFSVQLAYRVAGFVDQNLITVTAEQTSPGSTNASIVIPDENYTVYLGKPVPAQTVIYSGVVVTKVENGYTVSGYDTSNPVFTVLPSIINNNFNTITVGSSVVKVYQAGYTAPTQIPYGTTFSSIQQVTDFLVSYQRFLVSQGFVFKEFDTDLAKVRDWFLSINEFLFWNQQGWGPGTVIVLNPVADTLQINSLNLVVAEITNNPNGTRLLDINFAPIKSNAFDILRLDDPASSFSYGINNSTAIRIVDGLTTISYAKLDLIQYESTLVFDNIDDFGDIIYIPEQGTRQYRLKLVGSKTGGWDGSVSAAGYIYNNPTIANWQPNTDYRQGDIVAYNNSYYTAPIDIIANQNFNLSNWTMINKSDIQTGLLPSFGHNAQLFQNIYDVDNPPLEENYQIFSSGLIGFRERPFLSNLGMSIPTQTKFYQGYIKQKGTPNAYQALTKATFDNVKGTVDTYEEWAFQVGRYGDINNNQYTEFVLDESVFQTNPVAFTFTANTYNSSNIIVEMSSTSNVYNASNLYSVSTSLYNNRTDSIYPSDLVSAGYVNIADVDYQIFDLATISTMPLVGDGNTIWVAKDFQDSWNVYRVMSTDTVAITLKYLLDSFAQLTFTEPHNLNTGDMFVLQGFNSKFDGLYAVISAPNTVNVTVILQDPTQLIKTNSIATGQGAVFKLQSMVVDNITTVDSLTPLQGWVNGDIAWVNNSTVAGWGVYEYNKPWLANTSVKVTANTIVSNTSFGAASAISSDEKFLYIGNPGSNLVQVFANVGYSFAPNVTISNSASGFGSSIDTRGSLVAIGAPGAGKVNIYQHGGGVYTYLQTLTGIGSNKFGTSVSMSADGHWLYVGEPGDVNVYAYWTANVSANVHYGLVTGIASTSGSGYGSVVKTNMNGNVLYVTAPTASENGITNGNVYVYTQTANTFSLLQTITSQKQNNLDGYGTSIAVDGSGKNLFIGAPGSTATGYDDGLVERYVFNGTNYTFIEDIFHPGNTIGMFGSTMSVSSDAAVLAIGSAGSGAEEDTTFDNNVTLIDEGSTKFVEYVAGSGAIYMFESLIDQTISGNIGIYTFTQNLPEIVTAGDQFGSTVSVTRDLIIAGAQGTTSGSGAAYIYTNKNSNPTWNLIRSQEPKVDITSINRTFIYDNTDNIILSAIDYIDPLKGKVLNAVGSDIDYFLTTDPALYNFGNYAFDLAWGPAQVGKIWWNLDAVRYVDYEQDVLIYRLNNWGAVFPGSQILVYEWVESPVPPNQYVATVGDGYPIAGDATEYSIYGSVSQSGNLLAKYYFWVFGKTSIAPGNTNSVYSITSAIEYPQSQNIPYATVVRDDTIALYNVLPSIVGNTSVLHLGSKSADAGLVHSEYTLVQEGNPASSIPKTIENKLIDSLAQLDVAGNVVPDPALTPAQTYGIQIRPRQTMFANVTLARNNYITYVNDIMASYPVVERKLMTTLNSQEPVPVANSGAYNLVVADYSEVGYINTASISEGYTVLVSSDSTQSGKWSIYTWSGSAWAISRVQSYKTNLYWNLADWYEPGYDYTVAPDITVANNLDFGKLTLTAGTYIKVLNNGSDQFVVYYIDSNLTANLYGIQNGTVQISTGTIPSLEMRQIALAIQNDIFVDDLASNYNALFFTMIKYVLTEQKNVDWVFKTSFLSATQYIRALEQFPSYISDNQDYYLDYINEVKPYRTTIRQFVVDYQGNDEYYGDTTDFDLPPYWDANLQIYRSPSGEQPYDSTTLSSGVYSSWSNNYTYGIVNTVIENAGQGYFIAPQIAFVPWTFANGAVSSGSGATGYATLNGTGGIGEIIITDSGTGYVLTPNVIINGACTVQATATAVLDNVYDGNNTGHNLVRSIGTTMKFDRVNYTSANTFVFWNNITSANIGQTIPANTVVVSNDVLYVLGNSYTIDANIDFPSNVATITYGSFNNANDRIIASNGNIDLTLTQTGLNYPGVIVDGNVYTSTNFDSTIQSFYSNVFGVNPGDITIDGGQYISTFSSYAPEELIPGVTYDVLDLTVYDTANVAFREFQTMTGNLHFHRIAAANTTTLSSNLNMTDTSISVANASLLPLPNPSQNTPGAVVINGERIVYWRNYALETPTVWGANLNVNTATLVSHSGNLYLTTGNIYDMGGTFANISSNVTQVQANTLAQIRRGVDGTSTPTVQLAGSRVVDDSNQQLVPNSYPVSSNIGLSSKTYTTTANVSYKLSLTSNITANVGDFITQIFANSAVSANVQSLGNVVSGNVIPVIFIAGSLTTLVNTVAVNGTVASGVYTASAGILGSVNAAGNVTIPANTIVKTSNIWTNNNSSLDSSTTSQANFLKASLSYYATPRSTP